MICSNMSAYMRIHSFSANLLTPPLLGYQRARYPEAQSMVRIDRIQLVMINS
jgi:hypothetical protein